MVLKRLEKIIEDAMPNHTKILRVQSGSITISLENNIEIIDYESNSSKTKRRQLMGYFFESLTKKNVWRDT